MNLINYIEENYGGSQRAFAASQGVKPQQVTQWLYKGFIVVNGSLYSPRRELYSRGKAEQPRTAPMLDN